MIFANIKRVVAGELAVPVSDSRVADAVNEAQDHLIRLGKWKACYQRYRFCVSEGCITLPRGVEAIEAFAVEGCPGTVRSEWFEFIESGPGLVDPETCIGRQLVDRGLACAFDDVRGTGKKLAVFSDVTEAADAKIVLRFYDRNGQFVRTQQTGAWDDGEAVALPAAGAYAYTTNECMANGLVQVIKPRTNGTIRLYEYTVATGALKPLGYYHADETVPQYRRALIPNLQAMGSGSCENTTVDVMVKLDHIPIVGRDNDWLVVKSLRAFKLAAKAIKHEASNDFEGAAGWWLAAQSALDEQLRSHLGDGAVQPIRTPSPDVWGAAVCNLQ